MDMERAGWIREKEALNQQILLLQTRLDEENARRRKTNALLRKERQRGSAEGKSDGAEYRTDQNPTAATATRGA